MAGQELDAHVDGYLGSSIDLSLAPTVGPQYNSIGDSDHDASRQISRHNDAEHPYGSTQFARF